MDFGALIPVVAILATAGVIVHFLQYLESRHASRRAEAGAGAAESAESAENARLARDNDKLRLTVDRLEARLAVLERIATDPAERTAREIEQLRHDR
jgi:hypothetical protein